MIIKATEADIDRRVMLAKQGWAKRRAAGEPALTDEQVEQEGEVLKWRIRKAAVAS